MPSFQSSQGNSDIHRELDQHGLRLGDDDFVAWKPDEKQHPRNWSIGKKTYNVVLVCFFEFWMTAISSSGVRDGDSSLRNSTLTLVFIDCCI